MHGAIRDERRNMTTLIGAIENIVGARNVVLGEALANRPVSYWDSSSTEALALVMPSSTQEVSGIMQVCQEHGQSIVTQGGCTGCVQGAEADGKDIILSMERLTDIEDIDPVGGTVTVQAGVVLQTLQNTVKEKGFLFPLDLGARGSCTIGGNIATNAGGINVLRYGMMRQLVLGLEVVLSDGTILSSMQPMLKNNAGYDLKQLFIGSEGTLGVITRAVLRLFPEPLSCNTALVALETFDQVIAFLTSMQQELAGNLSAFEVMWQNYFAAVTIEGAHRAPLDSEYPFYILIETEGTDPVTDEERFNKALENAFANGVIVDAVISKSEKERLALWGIRENFEAITEQKPYYLYDISLPVCHMETYANRLISSLKKRWPEGCCHILGHIADGNLHLFIRPNQAGDFHEEADREVYGLLKEYGGSVSAEHGIGREKRDWLGHSRSDEEVALMRSLKTMMDPSAILNPGKVLTFPQTSL